MWLIILLALAVAAYFLARTVLKQADPAEPTETLGSPAQSGQLPDKSEPSAANASGAAAGHDAAGSSAPGGQPTQHEAVTRQAAADAAGQSGAQAGPAAGSRVSERTSGSSTGTASAGASVGTPDDDAALEARAQAYGVNSGDAAVDVRELIKILNLRESDAARLGIEKSTFSQLADGTTNDPSDDTVLSVRRQLIQWLS